MRPSICLALTGILISVACQPRTATVTQQVPANQTDVQKTRPGNSYTGIKTVADIAKFSYVNKRCRMFAADGDIDVDQTCLVVTTVKGGLVVIPNEYSDKDLDEILDQLGSKVKDKWLTRFYEVGGGEK